MTEVSISPEVPTTDKASALRLTESFPDDPDIAKVELKLLIVLLSEASIAVLWVWADPDKLEISFVKAFLIASLFTSADPLKEVIAEALELIFDVLVEILLALVAISESFADTVLIIAARAVWADPDSELISLDNPDATATLWVCADPLNVDTALLTSASVANVLSKEAVNVSKLLNLPSCTDCSDAIEVSRATLWAWAEPLKFDMAEVLLEIAVELDEISDAFVDISLAKPALAVWADPLNELISLDNPFSIATLCPWADPDNEVIPDALLEILELRAVWIATLWVCAEPGF